METKTEKIIKALVVSSFFVPLIFAPQSFIFPFIVPKILAFRSIVLLMLGCYGIVLYAQSKKYSIKFTPISIVVFLFLSSFILSTIFGIDGYRSIYDGQERMLGLLTLIHYVIYFLILSVILQKKDDWMDVMKIFLGAGSLVMIIGFFQRFVNTELLLNANSGRVFATLGNAIYFSGYGMFLFFLGLYVSVTTYVQSKGNKNVVFWMSSIASFLGLWGILLGGTRGTMLGVFAGLVAVFIGYIFFGKVEKKLKLSIASTLAILFVLIGILFAYRSTSFVTSIPGIGRLFNASLIEGTGKTRLMAWGIAIDAWKEKPVFGWGPNNYYYAFNQYYRPQFLEFGWGETWFDNAHSTIMNTLAVQGVFGLLTYILLFIIPIIVLYKAYKKESIDIHTFILFSAFLVAHFIHNALVFENPTSYLYFFFVLAFITSITTQRERSEDKMDQIPTYVKYGTGIMVVLLLITININPARANMSFIDFLRNFTAGKIDLVVYEKALSFNSPHNDDIRYDFAKNVLTFSDNYIEIGKKKEVNDLLLKAYNEVDIIKQMHPRDIRYHLLQADIAQKLAMLNEDSSWVLKKEALLEEALLYSPQRQQVLFGLADIKHVLRKDDQALALLQQALDSDKKVKYSWYSLINLYGALGDTIKVEALKLEAKEYGIDIK